MARRVAICFAERATVCRSMCLQTMCDHALCMCVCLHHTEEETPEDRKLVILEGEVLGEGAFSRVSKVSRIHKHSFQTESYTRTHMKKEKRARRDRREG